MVGFMLPLSIGIGLSVRMGAIIPHDVKRCQRLVVGTFVASVVLFAVICTLMYIFRQHIFDIFTDDQDVLDGCERIWWKVTAYFFNLSMYGVNMGIATGLGMQWMFGIVTLVCLWLFNMPLMCYFAFHLDGGFETA